MQPAAVLEDQWGLVSRAAADAYFWGPAVLEHACVEPVLQEACTYEDRNGITKVADLFKGCEPWRPQTRLARPLKARNTR